MTKNDKIIIALIKHPFTSTFALNLLEDRMSLSEEIADTLIEEAVYESDPSANGYYIKPCLRTIGAMKTSKKIMQYALNGTDEEKMGAIKLFYWVHEKTHIWNEEKGINEVDDQAKANNREEYLWRKEILINEYKNSDNPVLKFFYQWALPTENDNLLYDEPETDTELMERIKNRPELIELRNSLRKRKAEKENAIKYIGLLFFLLHYFTDSLLNDTDLEVNEESLNVAFAEFLKKYEKGIIEKAIQNSESIIELEDWEYVSNLPFLLNSSIEDTKSIVKYLVQRKTNV